MIQQTNGRHLLQPRAFALATFGAVLLFTTLGVSANWQAGIVCRKVSGGTYAPYFGTIFNSSSSSDMLVHCPLVNDENDDVLDEAQIRVTDRHSTLSVTCSVYAESISGSTLTRDGESKSSTGSSGSNQALVFSGPYDGWSQYAECTIPRTESGNASHVAYMAID